MSLFFRTVLLLLFSSQALAEVWPNLNAWDQSWEDKYSEWVKTNWNEHFFERPGTPYSGLQLDCADVIYSMRAIFASENQLPFAVQDSTNTSHVRLVSNNMRAFDRLPRTSSSMPNYDYGPRVRAFLLYLYETQGTFTIKFNTYPPRISRQTVRSGSVIITDKKSHHSWTIQDVLPSGIPHLIFASRPASSTLKQVSYLPSMEFTFAGYQVDGKPDRSHSAGFRNFRKIEDIGKPLWKIVDGIETDEGDFNGVSNEQYSFSYTDYRRIVQRRLALTEETLEERLRRLLSTSCQLAKERVVAVKEGVDFRATLEPSACMTDFQYDDFSTPNRDLRTRNSFEELKETFADLDASARGSIRDASLLNALDDVVADSEGFRWLPTKDRYCAFEFTSDRWMSLSRAMHLSISHQFSANPYDDLNWRWGFTDLTPRDGRANPLSQGFCRIPGP